MAVMKATKSFAAKQAKARAQKKAMKRRRPSSGQSAMAVPHSKDFPAWEPPQHRKVAFCGSTAGTPPASPRCPAVLSVIAQHAQQAHFLTVRERGHLRAASTTALRSQQFATLRAVGISGLLDSGASCTVARGVPLALGGCPGISPS